MLLEVKGNIRGTNIIGDFESEVINYAPEVTRFLTKTRVTNLKNRCKFSKAK